MSTRQFRKENPSWGVEWRRTHPAEYRKYRFSQVLRRYGITAEVFEMVFQAQDCRCAVCGSTEPGGKGTWHVDHDHETNKFRGSLCQNCNLGLGQFKDSQLRLARAIEYLAKFQSEKR